MDSQSKSNLSHVLAIDFGKSKVGLALADTETNIAFVYGVIENDSNLLINLEKIIQKEEVKKIIIGLPGYPNKTKGENGGKKLGDKLKEKLKIDTEYQEEMFTTKMAQDNLKERGGKNIAVQDDQEAAKIILQDWLDKA